MISNLLDTNTVLLDVPGSDKNNVLHTIITALEAKVDAQTLTSIREAVMEREQIMSTGVGKGLAIPHGKVKNLNDSHAVFARLASPIDYNAIDGEPVQLIFLLIGPKSSNSLHIKLLSRISRLMNNSGFREKLHKCKTNSELLEVFREHEQRNFSI